VIGFPSPADLDEHGDGSRPLKALGHGAEGAAGGFTVRDLSVPEISTAGLTRDRGANRGTPMRSEWTRFRENLARDTSMGLNSGMLKMISRQDPRAVGG